MIIHHWCRYCYCYCCILVYFRFNKIWFLWDFSTFVLRCSIYLKQFLINDLTNCQWGIEFEKRNNNNKKLLIFMNKRKAILNGRTIFFLLFFLLCFLSALYLLLKYPLDGFVFVLSIQCNIFFSFATILNVDSISKGGCGCSSGISLHDVKSIELKTRICLCRKYKLQIERLLIEKKN